MVGLFLLLVWVTWSAIRGGLSQPGCGNGVTDPCCCGAAGQCWPPRCSRGHWSEAWAVGERASPVECVAKGWETIYPECGECKQLGRVPKVSMPGSSQLPEVSSWTRADLWEFLPPLLGLGHAHVSPFFVTALWDSDSLLPTCTAVLKLVSHEESPHPSFLFLWEENPRTASLTTVIETAILWRPTNLSMLSSTLPATRDAGRFSHPALAWPSYRAVVLQFVKPIFDAVLYLFSGSGAVSFCSSLPDESSHSIWLESIFNKRCLGVGSSGVSYQQCRMKSLSLCSGLHGKKPHIKFYHVLNGNEMIKLG